MDGIAQIEGTQPAGLFGFKNNNSNRDLTSAKDWGKNVFNSTFPVALACYMHNREMAAVYLKLEADASLSHNFASFEQIFGINPEADDVFFDFEARFLSYENLIGDGLPRVDLVIKRRNGPTLTEIRPFEVKLTAIPDNSTFKYSRGLHGSELVIRPSSIIYLALAIAAGFREPERRHQLGDLILPLAAGLNNNWSDAAVMLNNADTMLKVFNTLLTQTEELQQPFLLHPVWRSKGKSLLLDEECLDFFVWSNYAFTRLFLRKLSKNGVTRPMRALFWLIRMLHDYSAYGHFNNAVMGQMAYGKQTDKSFAVSGSGTNPLMACSELEHPRVMNTALSSIIVGGGHLLLSPERRFDAAVVANPHLFGAVV